MSEYKPYLSAIQVYAKPETVRDEPGYRVSFSDGWGEDLYWMPKDQFEAHYFPIKDEDKLNLDDISHMVTESNIDTMTLGSKTTVVQMTLPTGFVYTESSSCVDPKNYDAVIGKKCCLDRMTNKLWQHLGFVLQWARHGLIYNRQEEKA